MWTLQVRVEREGVLWWSIVNTLKRSSLLRHSKAKVSGIDFKEKFFKYLRKSLICT